MDNEKLESMSNLLIAQKRLVFLADELHAIKTKIDNHLQTVGETYDEIDSAITNAIKTMSD